MPSPKRAPSFNLDAVEVEADGEPFIFTFGGEKFTLPAHMDMVAAGALATGQAAGLSRMLGDEQWKRLLALPAVLDEVRLEALLVAYGEHIGITTGESAASTDS